MMFRFQPLSTDFPNMASAIMSQSPGNHPLGGLGCVELLDDDDGGDNSNRLFCPGVVFCVEGGDFPFDGFGVDAGDENSERSSNDFDRLGRRPPDPCGYKGDFALPGM